MTGRAAVLTLALAAAAAPLAAQRKTDPGGPFASAKSLSCTFPTYATADVTKPNPQVTTNTQQFAFRIDAIDYRKRNAQIVGEGGTSLAAIVLTQTGLNVIEQTPLGNFTLTTVFTAGGDGQRFPAVHSRHLGDLKDAPRTSQSYGSCELPQ
jgi:hypothetical protein